MLYNRDTADLLMEEYQLDAVLASDPTTLAYLGYKLWLNSLRGWMMRPGRGLSPAIPFYCLIPHQADPVYILNSMSVSFLSQENAGDIICYNSYTDFPVYDSSISRQNPLHGKINAIHGQGVFDDPFSALQHALRKYDLEKAKIAVEGFSISPLVLNRLKSKFKEATFGDGSEIFRLMRMIKTDEEIEILTECARITESGMLRAADAIEPGRRFADSYSTFRNVVLDGGAELEHFALFPNGMGFTEHQDFVLEQNTAIAIDAGVFYRNYVSDSAMTLFVGCPDPKHREIYAQLLDIMETGQREIRPGVKCSQVFNVMNAKKIGYGFEKINVEGHGIGLNCREYPIVNAGLDYAYDDGFRDREADFTLEKNMVICLEVARHIYNESCVQIEKIYRITDSGCQEITPQNRSEPILR